MSKPVDVNSSLDEVIEHIAEKFPNFHPMAGLAEVAATGRLVTVDPVLGVMEEQKFKPEARFEALKQLNLKMTPGFKAREFTSKDESSKEDLLDIEDKALASAFINMLKQQQGAAEAAEDPIEAANREMARRQAAKDKE